MAEANQHKQFSRLVGIQDKEILSQVHIRMGVNRCESFIYDFLSFSNK
jgi:hypothetical protein